MVIHRNEHDEVLSRYIEIDFVPWLLRSQREDEVDSAAALADSLGGERSS